MPTSLTNTLPIARSAADVYAYVTQPWRWHEWHPNSKSATSNVDILKEGDTFDEVIEVQPLSPLPVTLRRATHYRVLVARPGKLWQVRGETADGWLEIRYELSEENGGTRFTRTLTLETRGTSRLLMPFLKPRMARMSEIALGNLRRKLEAGT